MSRPQKYGEPTKRLGTRLPLSILLELPEEDVSDFIATAVLEKIERDKNRR